MRFIIFFLFWISAISAQFICTVGDFRISQQELSEEMQKYAQREDLTYQQVRQMALDTLIDKYILIKYATENGISVDEVEIEAFFMNELGDLPRFQTNGVFSIVKYRAFIDTPAGEKIRSEMRKEILANKTKTLIENSYAISDELLKNQFIMDNLKFDLGYSLIDIEDADLPENVFLSNVRSEYERLKKEYQEINKTRLQLILIFKKDYLEQIKEYTDNILNNLILQDSTLSEKDIEEYRQDIEAKKTTELALDTARETRNRWLNNLPLLLPVIETHDFTVKEQLGDIPLSINELAFQMKKDSISQPIDLGEVILIFKVMDFKKVRNTNEFEIANIFWKDYMQRKRSFGQNYREYFEKNMNEFKTDAAIVQIIELKEPRRFASHSQGEFIDTIRQEIQANIEDPLRVKKIVEKHGLKPEIEILYLKKYSNSSVIQNVIANMINKDSRYGFLPSQNGLIFFQIMTIFPNFIPYYDDIADQVRGLMTASEIDTLEYLQYFEKNKKDFNTPDSLQLGGVFFRTADIADTLRFSFSDDELRLLYHKNIDRFYRKRSVKFDYIYVKDKAAADAIHRQLIQGKSFSLLKYCFNNPQQLDSSQIREYDSLPRIIRETLSRMLVGSIYQPVEFDHGWFLLNKTAEYNDGIASFEEVKEVIRQEQLNILADNLAYQAAKAVFDSTNYFSHLFNYLSEDQIFRTPFQNADQEYPLIGSIKNHKTDLMRIWRNEKYSSIITTKDGYAVAFVLQKKPSQPKSFAEALPEIITIFKHKKSYDNARFTANILRDELRIYHNPDSLFFFFGGWHRAENLTLNSRLPNVDFSHEIITDVVNRSEGYVSPVIKINEDQLMIYRLEKITRPSLQDFNRNRDEYYQRYIRNNYLQWLKKQRAKVDITVINE